MALLSVEGRCDSDAGILVGMPFEGRHCETIGQIHQVCRAEFPLDRLERRPCTLPGGQRCAPGAPSDHSRAPIASEGANRPATGLQTCTRQRGHRPQPSQVRRKPVPVSCGSAPAGLRHGRIPPPSHAMDPWDRLQPPAEQPVSAENHPRLVPLLLRQLLARRW